jgi:nucleoside-diphosphate-sugar epimerase
MAQKTGIPRFIEVSTAAVYKSQNSSPSKEAAAVAPCGRLASAKRAAEVALQAMTELKPIIVRPAMVYGGTGDSNGVIFGRMICASVYAPPAAGHSYEALSDASKGKKHKMTLLWDGGLKINTVHVLDVCRGLWSIFLRAPLGSVWNLCDKNDTDQAKVRRL